MRTLPSRASRMPVPLPEPCYPVGGRQRAGAVRPHERQQVDRSARTVRRRSTTPRADHEAAHEPPELRLREADGQVWVTRFEQRDAWCLTDPERRLAIGVEKPHDGIVRGRRVYLTTVDGHVVVSDLDDGRASAACDLAAMTPSDLARVARRPDRRGAQPADPARAVRPTGGPTAAGMAARTHGLNVLFSVHPAVPRSR